DGQRVCTRRSRGCSLTEVLSYWRTLPQPCSHAARPTSNQCRSTSRAKLIWTNSYETATLCPRCNRETSSAGRNPKPPEPPGVRGRSPTTQHRLTRPNEAADRRLSAHDDAGQVDQHPLH